MLEITIIIQRYTNEIKRYVMAIRFLHGKPSH